MKLTIKNSRLLKVIALATILLLFPISAMAQRGNANVKTDTKILYHGGPILTGSTDVYLIWYGNWTVADPDGRTRSILTEYVSFLGSSPYFQINTGYTDSMGVAPSGALLYAGSVNDQYSHGPSLTPADIGDVVNQMVIGRYLPLDTTGIYLVLTSPDFSKTGSTRAKAIAVFLFSEAAMHQVAGSTRTLRSPILAWSIEV